MKYLCLVYLDQEHWSACPDHVCATYAKQLSDSKRLIAGEPLHPVHTATTVRVRNGQVQLYDGPFAETKELLAGFYLVDAKDLNEAIQIASGIPPAQHGSVEVRPVRRLDLGNAVE
jgi:hypothetical protein